MIRKIRGTTAIITGATSGIGLETAVEFARSGANVVVAGRRLERLLDLVSRIQSAGGKAIAVPTDVSDQKQVDALMQQAVDRFGAVNTLVNNAGVGFAARFEDQSIEDFRRVMDVNFWGAVYASKAVIPQMRRQPAGGVIINISSIMGKRGVPYETAYCASKFALAGFSEALRTEVMSDKIDVSTIFPGAVETEIFQTSANQTGLEVSSYLPKFPARQLARIIVQNARFPQPEVVMAMDAQVVNFFSKVAPNLVDLALGMGLPILEGFRRSAGRVTNRTGNLYQASQEQATDTSGVHG